VLTGADVPVFRGALDNVLARFIGALDAHPADHVVRLTADCPLIDPQVVDAAIALHLAEAADYTSNTAQTFAFPKGLDVEIVSAAALRHAAAAAATAEEREHVTWGFWTQPDKWKIAWLHSPGSDDGDIRWTVDTQDDLAFVTQVYEALYPAAPAFTSQDIRDLIAARPDLVARPRKVFADRFESPPKLACQEGFGDSKEGKFVFRARKAMPFVGIDDIGHVQALLLHHIHDQVALRDCAADVVCAMTDQHRFRDAVDPVKRRP
jgi:spore coat polysaccharide biosynthesis protein SpsF (cytidylyltransferase family)